MLRNFLSGAVQAQDIYIRAGKIIETKNGKVLTDKTIIVSGEKIKSIRNGFVSRENETDSLLDMK
ncbi:hypothetical protein [Salegentibacter sediminis]|uniref:hypothetical protein n=1 Tax=Salegentibacter sediminis TaxID=1930251 RepID=UPI0009BDEA29|nr:hypothetical protein [Salegentibacter sediminis]